MYRIIFYALRHQLVQATINQKRISFTLLLLIAILVTTLPARAEHTRCASSTEFLEQSPWLTAFSTRADWLQFLSASNQSSVSQSYAALFDDEQFSRYVSQENTIASTLTYCNEGLRIKGIMVRPEKAGKYPIIVYNHGGVMQWGRIIFPEILEFHRLAEQGYVVIASSYRGEGGSEGQADMGGGDVRDVLKLIEITQKQEFVLPNKIGIWGFSRGVGVSFGLLRRLPEIKVAVMHGGVSDQLSNPRRAEFDEHVYPYSIREYAQDKENKLKEISPVYFIASLSTQAPILILHGSQDQRVSIRSALEISEALVRRQHPFQLKIFLNGSHDLVEHYTEVRQEIDAWFARHLKF